MQDMETPSIHIASKIHDPDSMSTQSTGQSYPDLASFRGHNMNSIVSAQTGSVSSIGSQDFHARPSFLDYGGSSAHMSLQYSEPCLGADGRRQPMFHPQLMGITPTRIPLPLNYPLADPIYVNAKQYHAILRRRRHRSKLEARNKVPNVRKAYIHESRHIHALKRARGSCGRFLNTKKLQESQMNQTKNMNESKVYHQPDIYIDNGSTSTTSCSDVTSTSNSGDMFHLPEYNFSGYPSHIGQISGFLR